MNEIKEFLEDILRYSEDISYNLLNNCAKDRQLFYKVINNLPEKYNNRKLELIKIYLTTNKIETLDDKILYKDNYSEIPNSAKIRIEILNKNNKFFIENFEKRKINPTQFFKKIENLLKKHKFDAAKEEIDSNRELFDSGRNKLIWGYMKLSHTREMGLKNEDCLKALNILEFPSKVIADDFNDKSAKIMYKENYYSLICNPDFDEFIKCLSKDNGAKLFKIGANDLRTFIIQATYAKKIQIEESITNLFKLHDLFYVGNENSFKELGWEQRNNLDNVCKMLNEEIISNNLTGIIAEATIEFIARYQKIRLSELKHTQQKPFKI